MARAPPVRVGLTKKQRRFFLDFLDTDLSKCVHELQYGGYRRYLCCPRSDDRLTAECELQAALDRRVEGPWAASQDLKPATVAPARSGSEASRVRQTATQHRATRSANVRSRTPRGAPGRDQHRVPPAQFPGNGQPNLANATRRRLFATGGDAVLSLFKDLAPRRQDTHIPGFRTGVSGLSAKQNS